MEITKIKEKMENIFFPHNKVKFLAEHDVENIIICNAFYPNSDNHCKLKGSRDVLAMIKCSETNTVLYENVPVVDDVVMMSNNAKWSEEFSPKEWMEKFFPYSIEKISKKKSLFKK